MGRRYKEKQMAASAGRRRPMIQLEGIGKRQVTEAPSIANKDEKPSDITGIELLGAYQEDSDVSDEGEEGQSLDDAKESKQNGRSDEGAKKPDIDDQLAGFLAEINALDTETTALPQDGKPGSGTQEKETQEVYDPSNFDPSTQWHLLPEPWQTCYDPNSGYYYYWRTDNDLVQWTPPPAPPRSEEPESQSKPVELHDSAETKEEGVMIGPQMPQDVPIKEVESDKKDEKDTLSQADKSPPQEKSSKGDDAVVASGPLVNYGMEDAYSSDAASDQEEKKDSNVTEDTQKQDESEKIEETTQQEDQKEEESSEETDEDITRKYSLHVSDDDVMEENTASDKLELGGVQRNVDADSEESEKERELHGRRVLRKYRKKVKTAESQEPESDQCKAKEKSSGSKRKRRRKGSRDSLPDKQLKPEGKGTFEVDMFAAESLSEGEIKSEDENEVSYKAISPVSDEGSGSGSSSGSSSSGSESQSDSSESDSEQENKTAGSKVEYEDISSDNASADVVLETSGKRCKGEPRNEEAVQKKEDKPVAESNLREAEDSQESEEEMQEFAEMLLEGALGTDSKSPQPQKDLSSKSQPTTSSNTVDQGVVIADNDVVMKDDQVNDEDGGPLLKAEVFEHIKKGEKKQVAYEEERKKATELHHAPDIKEEDYRTMIADTSSTLLEKLSFLDISRKGLTRFQIMLIEMETRLRDWREGALDGRYVVAKLASANEEMLKYESTAAPEGWSCHWDSNYKMYYYYNAKTEESTWQYPEVIAPLPSSENPQGVEQPPLPLEPEPDSSLEMIGPQPRPEQPPLPVGEPPDHPGFASAPLPPQQAPEAVKDKDVAVITKAGASSTVDQGESKKVIMDPYRARLLKKKEKQASTAPKPANTDEQISQLFLGTSQPPPPPPGEEDMPPAPWDDPISDGTRSPVGRASSRSASPSATLSGIASPSVLASKTIEKNIESTGIDVSPSKVLAAAQITAASVQATDHREPDVPTIPGEVMQLTTKKVKEKKEKKRKVTAATGLPSKKRKHVSSLVQKWQQVKQKVEEEMAEESSEEEDMEVTNLRKIEEWKAQQQVTGMAAYNPNFEEIKGDWRERVKKARQRRGLDKSV